MNQQVTGGSMDYREGFQDGVQFTREVVIANIRKWEIGRASCRERV